MGYTYDMLHLERDFGGAFFFFGLLPRLIIFDDYRWRDGQLLPPASFA
jgi:hypothetical protein